jgi:hypothetical protein
VIELTGIRLSLGKITNKRVTSNKISLFLLLFSLSIGLLRAAPTQINVTGATLIPTNTGQGATDVGMVYFQLQTTKLSATWSAVTITLTGTAADIDISSVQIHKDSGNGTWDGGGTDASIGSSTFSGGTANITLGASESVTTALSVRYYVVYNISGTATTTNTAGATVASGAFTANKAVNAFTNIVSGDVSLPVELGLWEATSLNATVDLKWVTESEIENQDFIIERASSGSATDWEEITSFITDEALLGQGSTTRQTTYNFVDEAVEVGETYSYRLADVDYVSNITYHDIISVTVRDDNDFQIPESISLSPAFPNPFNPLVNLSFNLKEAAVIELRIYDMQGRLVRTITEGYHGSGDHPFQWDGMDFSGTPQSSGVYLVRLSSGANSQIQRITLLR